METRVHALGARDVGLDVGVALGAIENVIGAEVNQDGVGLARGQGQIADAEHVHVECQAGSRLVFALVNAMKGRAVQDELRFFPFDEGVDLPGILHEEILFVFEDQILAGEGFFQVRA